MYKFKTNEFDYIANSKGYWITFIVEDREQAKTFLNSLKSNKDYQVEIKQKRDKRSLKANAYCWVLCEKIAKIIGSTNEEVYRTVINDVGVFTTIEILREAYKDFHKAWTSNGKGWLIKTLDMGKERLTLQCYKGSSVYDTEEMARLIDELVYRAKELDIPLEPPEEIERIKSLWRGQ